VIADIHNMARQIRRTSQHRRALMMGMIVVVVAVGCSKAAPEVPGSLALAAETEVEMTTTVRPTTTVGPTTTVRPTTTTSAPTSTSTIPPDPLRTWVATANPAITNLVAFDEPGGTPIALEFIVPNPHQFGGPLTLMVTEGNAGDAWVKVQLPVRPNGQEGWIRTTEWEITGTRVRAEVDLTARRVTVYDGEDVIAETDAVIGAPATPTPLGTFSITAKRRNPASESYLGPWALALSAYSEVYEIFSGGIPVIAIHGTTHPEQVGDARSNGCIRVPNEIVTFLAENVPLGAPVTVSS
jgi:lipoprotein-anchoring transpeptidase ErfK/SrfK